MPELKITEATVPAVLTHLRLRQWLVPQFQRDFVWTPGQVLQFINSILDCKPIGMATLWKQDEDSGLALDPVWLDDQGGRQQFSGVEKTPSERYAILDGRQRCTAIAMAFGGLRSQDSRRRYAGRYYLNVAEIDPLHRVCFFKEVDVRKRQLDVDNIAISQGLFPLASSVPGEELMKQWYRYAQAIKDPATYADGAMPDGSELARRNAVLERAFEGIIGTKLAVYIVPSTYTLADICEIFETLNTTGTKVSTVDLIHELLYKDTAERADVTPIHLREWIDDLGQVPGAVGWAESRDRPELIAQIATSCQILLTDPPRPRKIGRGTGSERIRSVKASDLLSTPTTFWQLIMRHSDSFARYLGHFQDCVAGGRFAWPACPYPVSAAAYVSLRWWLQFEAPTSPTWTVSELDALFRAFFWRNALCSRYDQGFLTQIGNDIVYIKGLLDARRAHSSSAAWARHCEESLPSHMACDTPQLEELVALITNGHTTGARRQALELLLRVRVRLDLLDGTALSTLGEAPTELHHIYPRSWCLNNKTGENAVLLDSRQSEQDWVGSTANLMPLSRRSNSLWKARSPAQALTEHAITFDEHSSRLEAAYIDNDGYKLLMLCPHGLQEFWTRRATLIAEDLLRQCNVSL